MDRIVFAGIKIDNLSFRETVGKIEQLIIQGIPSYVVTPNADHVVKLQHDKYFKEIYKNAALVLADGMTILWAAKVLGRPVRGKVSGSDLVPALCQVAFRRSWRLFFLGGLPGAAETARRILEKKYSGIQIGTHCPVLGFEGSSNENSKIVSIIKSYAPDMLFVGLGAPKQEKWIYNHYDKLGVPVSVGVGAAFDFMAGIIKRAPSWMQNAGFEWCWRLMQEPKRLWKRYLIGNTIFLWLVLKMLISSECNSNKYEE